MAAYERINAFPPRRKRSPFARFKGFLFGKGERHVIHGPRGETRGGGPGGYTESKPSHGHRGRAGRLKAVKGRYGESGESRYYRYKEQMRALAGAGYLKGRLTKTGERRRPKIKLSEAERKEEARIAARRRYHAKHPGAKYRGPARSEHRGGRFL
jgi:hypothetical protein